MKECPHCGKQIPSNTIADNMLEFLFDEYGRELGFPSMRDISDARRIFSKSPQREADANRESVAPDDPT